MKALLPALFLGILTFWSGTFAGGATFSGAVSAHAACLAFCLLAGDGWRDSLGLGGRGSWLVPAFLVVCSVSWWLSPVPRAGIVGLVLLPAFLLIPSAVARCWSGPRERRLGLAAMGFLLGVISLVALVQLQAQASPKAAMPLGHHNLLATWLVIVWPIGLLSLRDRGRWRVVAVISAVLTTAAFAATSSLLAFVALVIQALIAAAWWKRVRVRVWLAVAVLAVWIGPAVGQQTSDWLRRATPVADIGEAGGGISGSVSGSVSGGVSGRFERAVRVISRTDSSTRARIIYATGGWEGFKRRPLLGWGPGSVPWTNARFIEPVEGVNPPGEVVGDLHSWPLQLAYETGALGFAVVAMIILVFARRRFTELKQSSTPVVLQAALVGLGGGAVMFLGNAPVAVLALPGAVAVVAGAALSCNASIGLSHSRRAVSILVVYALSAALLLAPFERAHYYYERATKEKDSPKALTLVRRAAQLDQGFPLYRARAAWLAADMEDADDARAQEAQEALRAAREADGLAPLWLAAGTLGLETGQPWAADALEEARQLDPLSPLPGFHLLRARLRAGASGSELVELGESAVRDDGRLGAAVFWEDHATLRLAVIDRIGRGSPEASGLLSTGIAGPSALLAQSLDLDAARSFSLFAFRRSPWPADFAVVEVRTDRLPAE